MILSGHIAASRLCHRHLRADWSVALVAGLAPDVADKFLYYVLSVTPGSRAIMHTLWGWFGATLLCLILAFLLNKPKAIWAWSFWAGYGAHLLCDSPLFGGWLPFLYPLRHYDFISPSVPLGFLFGLDRIPVVTLAWETALTALAVYLERDAVLRALSRFRRRALALWQTR